MAKKQVGKSWEGFIELTIRKAMGEGEFANCWWDVASGSGLGKSLIAKIRWLKSAAQPRATFGSRRKPGYLGVMSKKRWRGCRKCPVNRSEKEAIESLIAQNRQGQSKCHNRAGNASQSHWILNSISRNGSSRALSLRIGCDRRLGLQHCRLRFEVFDVLAHFRSRVASPKVADLADRAVGHAEDQGHNDADEKADRDSR